MQASDIPRKGAVYARHVQTARDKPGPCILCGRPIDRTLPRDHAASVTAEHVLPITLGGHPLGPAGPAHRVCNLRRKNRPISAALLDYLRTAPLQWEPKKPGKAQPRNSQDW